MRQVTFKKNEDSMTATMMVDGVVNKPVHKDIPYIPGKLTDHRGLNLYLLMCDLGITLDDLDISADENLQGILSGAEYMDYPFHVIDAINDRA